MSKKQKLAKLLPILERLEQLEQALTIAPMAEKFNPVVYESGLSLLPYRKKDAKLEENAKVYRAWRDQIRENKMVRAARGLMLQFDEDALGFVSDITDKIRHAIENINPASNLTPKYNVVASVLQKTFHACLLTFEGLYEAYIPDIFAQGRFHQTVYNPREKNFKRFATFSVEESAEADRVHMAAKGDFETTFNNFADDLVEYATHLIQEKRVAKDELIERLEAFAGEKVGFFTDLMRAHLREAYAAGNLYQLSKDKVELVRWQSGQHIDDCSMCRAYQMGDLLLEVEDRKGNYTTVRHVAGPSGVAYYLEDIIKIAKEKGASYFNHDGCRCTFLPN